MTEMFQYSARKLTPADSSSTKECVTGCKCFFGEQSNHRLCVNPKGVWSIELDRPFYGDKKFFEIALYSFCKNCGGFEYACVPTFSPEESGDEFIYVVNDKNRPICVTFNRNEAIQEYIKLLKDFINPFGETAKREASINASQFF